MVLTLFRQRGKETVHNSKLTHELETLQNCYRGQTKTLDRFEATAAQQNESITSYVDQLQKAHADSPRPATASRTRTRRS